MSEVALLSHLPQNWIGICALIVFVMYVVGQVVEKYESIAKHLPLGEWWHKRQNSKIKPIDAAQVAKAVEDARHQWELDSNSALTMLEAQLILTLEVSKRQVADIEALQTTVRALRAWSGYDSRWHHKHEVENANNQTHVRTPHLDFFEFEKLWRRDPEAAEALP